mmetsp:Transcript_31980/g.77776  ORF Transcript_31980/g.77776 Transcript_31980/m.77776 type:complete len:1371 (-) Transcript_31980:247-4359(-)
MKFGVIALVATVAVLAGIVEAQDPVDLSKCVSFSFRCGGELYQAGEKTLTLPMADGVKDSCKMGGGKYRPMNETHWEDLQQRVLSLDLATIDATAKHLKCRGYQHRSRGWGPSMNAFACYYEGDDTPNYMWKKPNRKTPDKMRNTMPTCEKTAQYFSSHDPYLGRGQGCNPADDAPHQCQPGLGCVATVQGSNYKCLPDPMSDHECCLSNNEVGCEQGSCCAGSYCHKSGKCQPGWEPKSVTELKGICDDMTKIHPRKTGILEGNLCVKTPDIVFDVRRTNKKTQGDCALGLHCQGSRGYGFCKWWKKYQDKCAMKVWKRGCMNNNDCQVGTYCKQKARFSQCVPKPYGWETPEGEESATHDGLCTGMSLAERAERARAIKQVRSVFSRGLGECTGAIGSVWGDPHVVSYDQTKWNCQAQGDFVITNNTLIEVQGRFDGMKNKGYKISQSKAFAVKTGKHTPDDPSDDGHFQIWFPENYVEMSEDERDAIAGPDSIFQRGFVNDCPVAMRYKSFDAETGTEITENIQLNLVNGVVDVNTNQDFLKNHGSSVSARVEKVLGLNKGVYLILDFKSGATTRFRIHGGGSSAWNGCVMSVEVCLPGQINPFVEQPYAESVGLLGVPDGKKMNDWMDRNHTVLEMITSGADRTARQWEYCTKHWCIRDKTESIMMYKEDESEDLHLLDSQYYIDQCDNVWPGDMNPQECVQFDKIEHLLGEGKTFADFEATGNFPQKYLDACLECHMGPGNCQSEIEEVEELELVELAGIDGNPDPLDPPVVTCDNLGTDLSQTTGPTRFEAVPPPPKCGDEEAVCVGYDDSYGMFVGGALTVKMAEDLEGRLYVGAGLTIENPVIPEPEDADAEPFISEGEEVQLNGIGWATCGSHLCPSTMARVIEVCGNVDVSMPEDETVFIMPLHDEVGMIAYSGTYLENGTAVELSTETKSQMFFTNGEIKKVDPSEVCSIKTDLLTPLISKSSYWATDEFKQFALGVYGDVEVVADTGLIVLKMPAFETGCPAIFNIDAAVFNTPLAEDVKWTILFDKSIGTNTVLINVLGETVNFSNMLKMQEEVSCLEDGKIECTPSEGYAFSTELVTNLLWNFPQATSIQFGESFDIEPFTWEGSVLAPKADVTWHYSVHRGRLVVGGDMVIDRHDFVGMNYAFDPEACPLPKSPSDDCVDVLPTASDVCVVENYVNEDNGLSVCPVTTESIVQMAGSIGYLSEPYMDGTGIVYGIQIAEDKKTVKFNVNVPFDEADTFVKHSVSVENSEWLESRCDATMGQDNCLRDTNLDSADRQYEVACDVNGHATAYVFFATRDPTVTAYQATDGVDGAVIDSCCYPPSYSTDYAIVEFAYKIDCGCPSDAEPQVADRRLRH